MTVFEMITSQKIDENLVVSFEISLKVNINFKGLKTVIDLFFCGFKSRLVCVVVYETKLISK